MTFAYSSIHPSAFIIHPSHSPSSFVKRKFVEAKESFAATQQCRCHDRAAGEPFAAAGAMRDLDQVVGRIEEERVQTEFAAGARRDNGRIEPAVAACLDCSRNAQRRTARCIFFLRVMALFHPSLVLRKSRDELACSLSETEDD